MTALVLKPQMASSCTGGKAASGEVVSLLSPCPLPGHSPLGMRGAGGSHHSRHWLHWRWIGGFEGCCVSPCCLQQSCPCSRRRQTGRPQRSLLDYHGWSRSIVRMKRRGWSLLRQSKLERAALGLFSPLLSYVREMEACEHLSYLRCRH